MAKKVYRARQGDVFLIPRKKRMTDDEIKKLKKTTQPLALGEVSGHHHVVTKIVNMDDDLLKTLTQEGTELRAKDNGDLIHQTEDGELIKELGTVKRIDLSELGDDDTTLYVDETGNMILRAEKGALVEHIVEKTGDKADHHPIVLEPGDYEVKIPDEYEPDGWRRVID